MHHELKQILEHFRRCNLDILYILRPVQVGHMYVQVGHTYVRSNNASTDDSY